MASHVPSLPSSSALYATVMFRHWLCPHTGERHMPIQLLHRAMAPLGRCKGIEELGGRCKGIGELGGLPRLLWPVKGVFRERLTLS